jgi:hypothetical protein
MTTQITTATENGGIELTLSLDKLCNIIALAREFHVKGASSDPSASATEDDDIALATLEDRPADPTEAELRQLIEDLSEDAKLDLVALAWMARNDRSLNDWAELRRHAIEQATTPTAKYLMGMPLLADYLSAGLAALGRDCDLELVGRA